MASSDPEKSIRVDDDISPAPSTHMDDEYQLYKDGRELEADPEEVKRVLRKIDYRIIPILFVTYMLQYLDKNSINFSSVYGLQKGTHLHGQQYAWLGKSFSSIAGIWI
jgi:sugar phosphate permease